MKKGNPTVGVIIGIILFIMVLFLAYTIYCAVYTMSQGSDYAYLGDYTTYINTEDNLSPDYVKNDLIRAKKETYYSMAQIVVYNYNSSYRLGYVVKTSTSKYYIGNSMDDSFDKLYETTYENIVGSVNTRIPGVGGIFKVLTSAISLVITAVVFALFIMFAKEK